MNFGEEGRCLTKEEKTYVIRNHNARLLRGCGGDRSVCLRLGSARCSLSSTAARNALSGSSSFLLLLRGKRKKKKPIKSKNPNSVLRTRNRRVT